jgi:hypothetical protein
LRTFAGLITTAGVGAAAGVAVFSTFGTLTVTGLAGAFSTGFVTAFFAGVFVDTIVFAGAGFLAGADFLVGTTFLAALAGVFILEASRSKKANKADGRAIVACL